MERQATKTRGEREDEEVERLVRPSPKVKPPRHDRRRERVEVDADPDLDTRDKDLSKNFKDIGGSVAAKRVLERWAKGLAPQARPPAPAAQKPHPPAGGAAKPPAAPKKRVKVRVKDTGKVVWVGEQTLKEDPGGYEPVEDEAEETKAPAKPEQQSPQKPSKAPGGVWQEQPKDKAAPSERDQLRERLRSVTDELKGEPESPEAKRDRDAVKDALKALDDYDRLSKELEDAKATLTKIEQKKSQKNQRRREQRQKLKSEKPPPAPDSQSAPAQPSATPPDQSQPPQQPPQQPSQQAPQQPAQQPAQQQSQPPQQQPQQPLQQPSQQPQQQPQQQSQQQQSQPPQQPAQPAPTQGQPISGQPQRPVSTSEREASDRLVLKTFPAEVAATLLLATPTYHPDEVQALISDYNLAKSISVPKDVSSLVDKTAAFYTTDPNNVPPPKKVETDQGEVAYDSIKDPAEKAKALRRHQVQTVAMSLAVRSALAGNFERQGAPKELAETMSSFMLSSHSESPKRRDKRATKEAERIYYAGLAAQPEESPPLSDQAVQTLLQSSDDPAVQKLIVGYCQASDYQAARKQFLDPKSKKHISEHESSRAIATGIGRAADFLRQKTARYPAGTTAQDNVATFRNRVMKHLNTLVDADKQDAVQGLLDVQDNRQYDEDVKTYDKVAKEYEDDIKKVVAEYKADVKAYRAKRKTDPNAKPPMKVAERLLKKKLVEPKKPTMPPRYNVQTQSPAQLAQKSTGLWSAFTSRFASTGSAARVAHAFSFYSEPSAMDRTAVYWGVEPYPKGHEGFEPYADWEQPQARDLGEADYSRVLKAARKWLSTPVLSTKIDGIVRDTQLRAALDLALRGENCDHAVHPTLYNKLLARLAGVSEDKPLLTVRSKAARNTMSNNKLELETAQADRFLARLDRIASVVQANHSKWGMDFAAAKNLVNALDKLADDLESATYGSTSLLNRQVSEIGHAKLAEVLQRDSDEKYMDTFKNPMKPRQTEADEPYMKAYGDDQSSGVHHGKSSTGRPLAP